MASPARGSAAGMTKQASTAAHAAPAATYARNPRVLLLLRRPYKPAAAAISNPTQTNKKPKKKKKHSTTPAPRRRRRKMRGRRGEERSGSERVRGEMACARVRVRVAVYIGREEGKRKGRGIVGDAMRMRSARRGRGGEGRKKREGKAYSVRNRLPPSTVVWLVGRDSPK